MSNAAPTGTRERVLNLSDPGLIIATWVRGFLPFRRTSFLRVLAGVDDGGNRFRSRMPALDGSLTHSAVEHRDWVDIGVWPHTALDCESNTV